MTGKLITTTCPRGFEPRWRLEPKATEDVIGHQRYSAMLGANSTTPRIGNLDCPICQRIACCQRSLKQQLNGGAWRTIDLRPEDRLSIMHAGKECPPVICHMPEGKVVVSCLDDSGQAVGTIQHRLLLSMGTPSLFSERIIEKLLSRSIVLHVEAGAGVN